MKGLDTVESLSAGAARDPNRNMYGNRNNDIHSFQYSPWEFMDINVGNSECDKSVDNYYDRNFGSHTAPAERLSTVSSPFLSVNETRKEM